MNNFQLNNTSVYLGGQCKWDIILSHKDDELIISGFQLTPISSNVPFNKKGEVTSLNDDHSYTLKKFCSELKEGFWSVEPCLFEHTRADDGEERQQEGFQKYDVTGYYDDSFITGLKRAHSYQVYNKQYEFFQPLWLERLEPDQYLRFKFNVYSTGRSGKKTIVDSRVLNLKDSNLNGTEFHNDFVKYFNNWLTYLNIVGDGNDKVLYIDLQKGVVTVDGVSILSGQRSGEISCDYIAENLLSYERPNIETDYILSTLFKNHNAITSQLFNLNFCMDLSDILDPFLMNQMKGGKISIGCEITVVGDNTYTMDVRSLYTNYEFVQKDTYNPFLYMDNIGVGLTSTGQATGEFRKLYTEKYLEEIPEDWTTAEKKYVEGNVLEYLKDYKIYSLKDKNKIVQPIFHWGYVNHTRDTFNLYEGYFPYVAPDDIAHIDPYIPPAEPGGNEQLAVYYIKPFSERRMNGVNVPLTDMKYTLQNGTLDWIFPKSIIYFDYNRSSNFPKDISDKFIKTYWLDSVTLLQKSCLWSLRNSLMQDQVKKQDSDDTFTFLYLKNYSGTLDSMRPVIESPYYNQWVFLAAAKNPNDSSNTYPGIFYRVCNGVDMSDFLIVTNDVSHFTLEYLCNIKDSDMNIVAGREEMWNKFEAFRYLVKTRADLHNNEYDFYGFKQEIEVGKDDLDRYCYYKALSRNTFLYRRGGKLSPYMIEDDDFSANYEYFKYIKDNSINKIDYTRDLSCTFENNELGKGATLVLYNKLKFEIKEKSIDDHTPIKTNIKDLLAIKYGYITKNQHLEDDDVDEGTRRLVEYIYNLYDVEIKYDYSSIYSLDKVDYNINMILK